MYKCDKCHKVTKPGEKQHKKVIEVRNKTYYYTDKNGQERRTAGAEIVKEINICDECFEKEKLKD